MRLDLNKYVVNKAFIQEQWRKSPNRDIGQVISMVATSTHCPCVVLAFYLAEGIGYTPELTKIIGDLIKFYGYTEILNQSEGSPFLKKS
jgi:hypothetical protein